VNIEDINQAVTWMDRHERRMQSQGIVQLEKDSRTLLRTFAPEITPRQDNVAARRCLTCNPPPHVFKCPVCDWTTELRWRFSLHLATGPGWCVARGKAKERKWASRV